MQPICLGSAQFLEASSKWVVGILGLLCLLCSVKLFFLFPLWRIFFPFWGEFLHQNLWIEERRKKRGVLGYGRNTNGNIGSSSIAIVSAPSLHLHLSLMCRGDLWGALWRLVCPFTHHPHTKEKASCILFLFLLFFHCFFSCIENFHELKCFWACF